MLEASPLRACLVFAMTCVLTLGNLLARKMTEVFRAGSTLRTAGEVELRDIGEDNKPNVEFLHH